MSARHRPIHPDVQSVEERRARSKGDRHRVHSELSRLVQADVEDRDALDGPVDHWVRPHHQRPVADDRRPRRVWKQRFWKRRSTVRAQRAVLERTIGT